MTSFTRTLTFKTNDLGADATLMLTFDKFTSGLYNGKFPVCWKVTRFASRGPYHITVTYESQLAFSKPQIDHASDTIVDAATYQGLNLGQKTDLKRDSNGVFWFTDPVPDDGNNIKAFNKTPLKEDMAVGFLKKGDFQPTPVLYFSGVGSESFVQAEFTPFLHAYVTSQYQETQIIRAEVDSPLLWEENLAALPANTTWDVKYDFATGKFSIVRA